VAKKRDDRTGFLFREEIPKATAKPEPYRAPQRVVRHVLPARGDTETLALKHRARTGVWADWYLQIIGGEHAIPRHMLAALPHAIEESKRYRARLDEWLDREHAWIMSQAVSSRFIEPEDATPRGLLVAPEGWIDQRRDEFERLYPLERWSPWPPLVFEAPTFSLPKLTLRPSTEGRAIEANAFATVKP
jgi:hypothetical protein